MAAAMVVLVERMRGCGTRAARVVDGVQVREQYISVTRRRVIKGGVAGGSG